MTDSELISDIDCESLLLNISKGNTLKEHELSSISQYLTYAQRLPKHRVSFDDLYSILTVLTRNNDAAHAYLVNQFLNFQDSLIAGLALETLVCRWNCYDELHERLAQFILGVPWDKDQDLKISALQCVLHIMSQTGTADEPYRNSYVSLIHDVKNDKNTDSYAADICNEILQHCYNAK